MAATMNQVQTFKGGENMFTEEAVRQFVIDSVAFHAQEREEAKRRLVELLKACRAREEAREEKLRRQLAVETDPDQRESLRYSIGNAEGAASAFRFVINLLEGNMAFDEEDEEE